MMLFVGDVDDDDCQNSCYRRVSMTRYDVARCRDMIIFTNAQMMIAADEHSLLPHTLVTMNGMLRTMLHAS